MWSSEGCGLAQRVYTACLGSALTECVVGDFSSRMVVCGCIALPSEAVGAWELDVRETCTTANSLNITKKVQFFDLETTPLSGSGIS